MSRATASATDRSRSTCGSCARSSSTRRSGRRPAAAVRSGTTSIRRVRFTVPRRPAGRFGDTGVAGLTLGGGLGHLSPSLGLTLDNLLAATVVTADGTIVSASEARIPSSSGHAPRRRWQLRRRHAVHVPAASCGPAARRPDRLPLRGRAGRPHALAGPDGECAPTCSRASGRSTEAHWRAWPARTCRSRGSGSVDEETRSIDELTEGLTPTRNTVRRCTTASSRTPTSESHSVCGTTGRAGSSESSRTSCSCRRSRSSATRQWPEAS